MLAQQLGFSSSWKMLTRDKGWIKPLLILALVGWIPILGQIAVLGYAYEWARLTAWGVDAAPKQHGVDYGKVLSTGGRAWLVLASMSIVVGLVVSLLFGRRDLDFVMLLPWNVFSTLGSNIGRLTGLGILGTVLAVLFGAFAVVAMMRTTIYDRFSAGWRLDRLFQMIGRDVGGFFKVLLVALIGSLVVLAYSWIALMVFGLLALSSLIGLAGDLYTMSHMFEGVSGEYVLRQFVSIGAGPVAFVIICVILAMFVYGVISTAMQLVAINAAGQWFCRFEVSRWGVSSAPLPDGVPAPQGGQAAWTGATPPVNPQYQQPQQPQQPAYPAGDQFQQQPVQPAAGSQPQQGQQGDSYWDSPVNPGDSNGV